MPHSRQRGSIRREVRGSNSVWPTRSEARPGRRGEPLAQGLPPIELITSSWVRPCCMHQASSRLTSTGSGRSRDASSTSSGRLRVCSRSITCCLLYSMAITKLLCQPDATVAHASDGWRPLEQPPDDEYDHGAPVPGRGSLRPGADTPPAFSARCGSGLAGQPVSRSGP